MPLLLADANDRARPCDPLTPSLPEIVRSRADAMEKRSSDAVQRPGLSSHR